MASTMHPSGRSPADPHRALDEALAHYRRGQQDVHEAAREAGVEDWAFLIAARATPDPVAPELDKGLKPFQRHRP